MKNDQQKKNQKDRLIRVFKGLVALGSVRSFFDETGKA